MNTLPELPLNLIYWHLWSINIKLVHQSILLQLPTRIPVRLSWLKYNFSPQTEILIKDRKSQRQFRYVHSNSFDLDYTYGYINQNDNSIYRVFHLEKEDEEFGLAIIYECILSVSGYCDCEHEVQKFTYCDFIQVLTPNHSYQDSEVYFPLPWKAINLVVDQKIPIYHDYLDEPSSITVGEYPWYQDISVFKKETRGNQEIAMILYDDDDVFVGANITQRDYFSWLTKV